MSEKVLPSACFLCTAPSEYYEFDGGKRRHYRCTGAACGEFVVTDTARRRLDVPHATPWKTRAAALAKRNSNEANILEIWVNPSTQVLETHLVDRVQKIELRGRDA